MIHIPRFTLVFSVLALTWAPVAAAGDEISDPSALETALGVLLDILVPPPDGEPGITTELPDAGPQVIFVG